VGGPEQAASKDASRWAARQALTECARRLSPAPGRPARSGRRSGWPWRSAPGTRPEPQALVERTRRLS